ncbi:MAG: hypothetical protein WBL41_19750, partial [Terracidiphilus sp.]
ELHFSLPLPDFPSESPARGLVVVVLTNQVPQSYLSLRVKPFQGESGSEKRDKDPDERIDVSHLFLPRWFFGSLLP